MSVATEPVPPAARADARDPQEPSRGAAIVVAAAAVIAALLLLWLGRDRTFFFDEWNWVQDRSFGGLDTLLQPHNEHVSIVPVAIYRALFELFGLSHGWPFRLPAIAVHLACAGLLFVLVRRRAGAAWGALAAVLLLFLGQAWEDLVWGFQVGFLLSALGGLVAWWALDRRDTRGDVIACVALTVGALSSSLGVPVALGVLAELAYSRRWTAVWVAGVPLAAYAAWYLGYGHSDIVREGVWHAPRWAVDAAAASAGALFGRGLDWGRPLLVALVIAGGFAILRRGLSARLVGVLAAGGAFWLLTGAARSAGPTPQPPDTSRYLYLGAIVVVLAAAELLRGRPLLRPAWGIAAVVAAAAVLQGLGPLHDGARGLRDASDGVKAQIAAATLVGPRLPADYHFANDIAPQLVAGKFLNAVKVNGSSPVPDPKAELAGADGGDRALADDVFVAVDAALEPGRACGGSGQVAPKGERAAPRGGLTVAAGAQPVSVGVRRYGATVHGLGTIPAGQARRVRIASDAAPEPWRVEIGAPATTCP